MGARGFKKWLGVVLTDCGSEFFDWRVIKRILLPKGGRYSVLYCDPTKLGQKGDVRRSTSSSAR